MDFLLGLRGLDRNLQHEGGATSFYKACSSGHVGVIPLLLSDERVDVNLPMGDGASPFYSACSNGHVGAVCLLLENHRVDVNRPMRDGSTPFFYACERGHAGVVTLMLANSRVDVDKPWRNEATPFYHAAQNGHLLVIECFLRSGRQFDSQKKSTFSDKTAAEQARSLGIRTEKAEGESNEEFQRRKANCVKIADLIDAYEKERGRNHRREERGLNGTKHHDFFLGESLILTWI